MEGLPAMPEGFELEDLEVEIPEGFELETQQDTDTYDKEEENINAIEYEDVTDENIEQQKELLKQQEYDTYKAKIDSMPTDTEEQVTAKKKAQITLLENKDDPTILDRIVMSAEASARTMVSPFIGIAELSEDISNLFKDQDSKTIENFRKEWNGITNKIEEKLGYEKDDLLKPSLVGQIGGEIATVTTGTKALSALGKTSTVAKAASLEGATAFLSELGVSGDYKKAATSGALAMSITGVIGRFIEGRPLGEATQKALDEASPEELTNIANIYEFARANDIKIVDAMLSNNPNKIIAELKSISAPEALIDYAETLKTDTGKKLLQGFNDVFKDVKPNSIDDINLQKIAQTMQEESSLLKKEMTEETDEAYKAMKNSESKDIKIDINKPMNVGLKILEEYRGDSSLVNAFKRNVLKNVKTLQTGDASIAKRIKTLEDSIERNQDRLSGFEVSGISTESLQKTIDKDIANLEQITDKIDMSKIGELSLEDIVGVVKDMNELKYSGSAHVATKGAREQKTLSLINEELMKVIEEQNPEFYKLAKTASNKARETFSIFGKQGRGTHEFPELEKIRMTKNPADVAKVIFKTDAKESGYKLEKTLELLGERNPSFQKQVIGKYINDSIGGFAKYEKGKNTIKQTVLNMDEASKGIDNLISSPESKRLTEKMIGKENSDTLFTISNFLKQHKENIEAMSTPTSKAEGDLLALPMLRNLVKLANYATYKASNNGIFKDKYHSQKYQKQVNKYIKTKLDEFNKGKKSKADWNRAAYALTGSVIEKSITERVED